MFHERDGERDGDSDETAPRAADIVAIVGHAAYEDYLCVMAWFIDLVRAPSFKADPQHPTTLGEFVQWSQLQRAGLEARHAAAVLRSAAEERGSAPGTDEAGLLDDASLAWGAVKDACEQSPASALVLRRHDVLSVTGAHGPCTLANATAASGTPLDYTDNATLLVYKS